MPQDDRFEYLLRLGDNALVLSQRLSEWCGKGPAFEEDMALTNVALDLLGQARLWLTYAGEVEGRGRDENRLAFLRDAPEFRNLLLVELPNDDYARTLARQFLFDAWHALALQALARSSDARIAHSVSTTKSCHSPSASCIRLNVRITAGGSRRPCSRAISSV